MRGQFLQHLNSSTASCGPPTQLGLIKKVRDVANVLRIWTMWS
jgi:hypothetical protein